MTMKNEPNWRCPSCGHKMWAESAGNVEFSVIVGCPGCGTVMDRLDPLGEIEAAAQAVERARWLWEQGEELARIREELEDAAECFCLPGKPCLAHQALSVAERLRAGGAA